MNAPIAWPLLEFFWPYCVDFILLIEHTYGKLKVGPVVSDQHKNFPIIAPYLVVVETRIVMPSSAVKLVERPMPLCIRKMNPHLFTRQNDVHTVVVILVELLFHNALAIFGSAKNGLGKLHEPQFLVHTKNVVGIQMIIVPFLNSACIVDAAVFAGPG